MFKLKIRGILRMKTTKILSEARNFSNNPVINSSTIASNIHPNQRSTYNATANISNASTKLFSPINPFRQSTNQFSFSSKLPSNE